MTDESESSEPALVVRRRRSLVPARYERLLILIAASFVFSGVDAEWARILTVVINVILVIVAFRATSLRISTTWLTVLGLVAVGGLIGWLITDRGTSAASVPAFAEFLALMFVAVTLIRAVLRRPVVDTQTVVGAITAYIVIGMALSWFYLGIDSIDSNQLSLDAADTASFAEFSFVVLTTLGFGNQLPTAAFSGRIVVMEAMFGQIFLATFVARLVSRHGTSRAELFGDDEATEE